MTNQGMFDVPLDWSLPAIQTFDDGKARSALGNKKSCKTDNQSSSVSKPKGHKLAQFQRSSRSKKTNDLAGSRFRYLNEKLYTMDSLSAMLHFQKNPQDFVKYHHGFTKQVSSWPCNPVDKFIAKLNAMKTEKCVVDLGCGEGQLALAVQGKHKVRSFDLQAIHPHIEVGDMCKLDQVKSASTDIVIFCLSLMNTNYVDALQEAHRILVNNSSGRLWIAEVASRFPNKSHHQFSMGIGPLFKLIAADDGNGVFVLLEYQKVCDSRKGIDTGKAALGPCLYKKR